MTKNSNTEPTSIKSNSKNSIPIPMIMKLVTGDEIIVSSLTRDEGNDNFLITNPYVVMRSSINNIPHLYLTKWISYSGSDMFMLNGKTIMVINIPNQEIMAHYNVCLEEENMNAFTERSTTSQISYAKH